MRHDIVHAISHEVDDGQAQAIDAVSAGVPSGRVGLLQARRTEVPGCVRRQRLGRRRGAEILDHLSDIDLRRSSARRCVVDAIAGRPVWRRGGVLRLQPRDRGWAANVSLLDRGGLRGDSTSVERQQCLPRDRPQDRHKQAQALRDSTHVNTGRAAERGVLCEGCSHGCQRGGPAERSI